MVSQKTPIIFLIYNRPELTQKSISAIADYGPDELFVIADGPKNNRDEQLCKETREKISRVIWKCNIQKNYSDINLGCSKRVSSGISWAFQYCDLAIILEDDCIPDPTFFQFCEELLERYKDDDRIGMISGNNFGFNLYDKNLSYSFSKHGKITGWATWKRCWEKFDLNMGFLDKKSTEIIKSNISPNAYFVEKWWEGVDAVLQGKSDSWAFPWAVTRYLNNWLTIRPKVNLVAHIGFGENATHTKDQGTDVYKKVGQMSFPLVHPSILIPDVNADRQLEDFTYPQKKKRNILQKANSKFKGLLKRIQDYGRH